jgi:release factor glutamine methyltransferase
MNSGSDIESNMAASDTWTVSRILAWAIPWLESKLAGQPCSPKLECEILLAWSLGVDRTRIFLQFDRPLTKSEREKFKDAIKRRSEREPVAYITGYRDFWRHRFEVNSSVLIPRPDTEILVELAIESAKLFQRPSVLDVGTGSGCIAVSIAKEIETSIVTGWDISERALDTAKRNAESAKAQNVSFEIFDVNNIKEISNRTFDIIVSNPPYIADSERSDMSRETLEYEPALALFAPDQSGLHFYSVLAESGRNLLNTGGKIFLEVGWKQAAKVAQLFDSSGWRKINIYKDLSGHERVVTANRD